MKIRKGFVSNSSSSSYILCGVNTDDLTEDILEKFEKRRDSEEYEDLWDCSFGEDGEIIGESLVYWENFEELNEEDFSPEKIKETKNKVKELFKKNLEYDVPDELIKLIATTYYG